MTGKYVVSLWRNFFLKFVFHFCTPMKGNSVLCFNMSISDESDMSLKDERPTIYFHFTRWIKQKDHYRNFDKEYDRVECVGGIMTVMVVS